MNSTHISTTGHQVSEALGLWEPKRTLTLEAARKHTYRIKLFRRILLGISAGLLFYLAYEFATQGRSVILEDNPEESVKMVNPRYTGRTDDGLPFYLTAASATRTLNKKNVVDLQKPVLEFYRESNTSPSYVFADEGTYDDVNKILNLRSTVKLKTDDGYICKTAQARIIARKKRITGNKRIECVGNFGVANGNAFEIYDNYKVFVFKNGMDAILDQDIVGQASTGQASTGQVSTGQDGTSQASAGQASVEAPSYNQIFGGSDPIYVTAQDAVFKGGLTTLKDNVDVRQGVGRLESDTMVIHRAEKKPEETGQVLGSLRLGPITRIDAQGNFRYTTPDNTVLGTRGVYERIKEVITVTGDVTIRQPSGNTAATDKLIYEVKTGTIRFSGDCIGPDCLGRSSISLRNENGN